MKMPESEFERAKNWEKYEEQILTETNKDWIKKTKNKIKWKINKQHVKKSKRSERNILIGQNEQHLIVQIVINIFAKLLLL